MSLFTSEYKAYCARITSDNVPTPKETNELKLRLCSSVKGLANRMVSMSEAQEIAYRLSRFYYDTFNNIRCEKLERDNIEYYDTRSGDRKAKFFSQMTIDELYAINEFLEHVYAKHYND